MKRILAWILAASFWLMSGYALADEAGRSALPPMDKESVDNRMGIQRGTEIIVGTTTALSGYFSMDLWGRNTADMDVRALLHGYSTVSWSVYMGGFLLDQTVVRDLRVVERENGNRVYTIFLSEGMTYNDGTPITAKDYLFSLLLVGAKEIQELGGTPEALSHIVGYDEYAAGATRAVSGLRLVSEHAFSLEIKREFRDYFYLLALINATPYPIGVIAPGCDVIDEGAGAFVGAQEGAASVEASDLGFQPGEFGTQMLRETLLDPQTGYVFNPRVTSGAYSLESFDAEQKEARFIVNERYAGNYEGKTPHIEKLAFRQVHNETMASDLAEGRVHLLNKVVNGVALNEAFALTDEQGGATAVNYPRSGFAFLSFACEQRIPSSANVRKAIAHCIDKAAYVASAVGGYAAIPVYGYYGVGQWMTQAVFEEDAEAGLEAFDASAELAALDTPYDLGKARELLVADGWTLNEAGEAYTDGDGTRYREENGVLEPLVIRWAKTEGNPTAEAMSGMLAGALDMVGIELEVTELPFEEVLRQYYRQDERAYDMFYLATNFMYVFDPYYDYNVADAYQGTINTTGLRDETLMQLADDLRKTYPTDARGYAEKWLSFQRRWVEQMPMVPLYSNVYFDFYVSELQGYDINAQVGWAQAIPYAWIGEAEDSEEAQPTEGGMLEDEISFLDE